MSSKTYFSKNRFKLVFAKMNSGTYFVQKEVLKMTSKIGSKNEFQNLFFKK